MQCKIAKLQKVKQYWYKLESSGECLICIARERLEESPSSEIQSSRTEYWEKPKSLPFHKRMGETWVTGDSEGGVDGEETPAGCEDDGLEPLAFALVALSHSSSS